MKLNLSAQRPVLQHFRPSSARVGHVGGENEKAGNRSPGVLSLPVFKLVEVAADLPDVVGSAKPRLTLGFFDPGLALDANVQSVVVDRLNVELDSGLVNFP